jgi:hypothetical protein
MEILVIIGFLFLALLIFVGGGLFGWVLKGIGEIFGFLSQGCSTSMGCLFWVLAAVIFILAMAA